MTAKRKPRKADNARHVEELTTYLERRGPGNDDCDPTPERVAKAKEMGLSIKANIIHTEAGFPTGAYYWSITPAIDDLKRRGSITEEEYEAAFRFMRHWHHGIHRGPPTIRYAPRYDGEVSDLTPGERQWHYAGMARRAFQSVEPMLQPALAWLVQALGDPVPLRVLGQHYAPDKGAQTQSSQGAMVLRLACARLCEHYGIQHSFSRRRIERLSEILLAQLTISTTA